MNVTAQILGLTGIILLPLIYASKKHTTFYLLHALHALFRTLQFLCLNAMTGMAGSAVSVVKNSVFLLYARKDKQAPLYWLIIFLICSLGFSFFNYEGLRSILPILAIIITGIGNWQHNFKLMCWANITGCVLLASYAFIVQAYGSLPAYALELVVALIRLFHKNNPAES